VRSRPLRLPPPGGFATPFLRRGFFDCKVGVSKEWGELNSYIFEMGRPTLICIKDEAYHCMKTEDTPDVVSLQTSTLGTMVLQISVLLRK
jgi:hypothetical protein